MFFFVNIFALFNKQVWQSQRTAFGAGRTVTGWECGSGRLSARIGESHPRRRSGTAPAYKRRFSAYPGIQVTAFARAYDKYYLRIERLYRSDQSRGLTADYRTTSPTTSEPPYHAVDRTTLSLQSAASPFARGNQAYTRYLCFIDYYHDPPPCVAVHPLS